MSWCQAAGGEPEFLSIKVRAASYFSVEAGDVRASSALLPALAPGGFITSLLACDGGEAIQFKEEHANKLLLFCFFFLVYV